MQLIYCTGNISKTFNANCEQGNISYLANNEQDIMLTLLELSGKNAKNAGI
jgi:hypothetical protein